MIRECENDRGTDFMIHVVIVDDCGADREAIDRIVRETGQKEGFDFKVTAIGDAGFFKEDVAEGRSYDIFLLDVEMPGSSGMELARMIQEKYGMAYIIFITSHIEYCPDGYEVGALRYILKEKMKEKLPEALAFVVSQIRRQKERFLVVSNGEGTYKVSCEDIIQIVKEDNKYAAVFTPDGQYRLRSSIRTLMASLERLPGGDMFIVANKGIIVNVRHIHDIGSDHSLHLSYGLTAQASKSHIADVKQRLLQYCLGITEASI